MVVLKPSPPNRFPCAAFTTAGAGPAPTSFPFPVPISFVFPVVAIHPLEGSRSLIWVGDLGPLWVHRRFELSPIHSQSSSMDSQLRPRSFPHSSIYRRLGVRWVLELLLAGAVYRSLGSLCCPTSITKFAENRENEGCQPKQIRENEGCQLTAGIKAIQSLEGVLDFKHGLTLFRRPQKRDYCIDVQRSIVLWQ